jgi:hypothetical protein
VRGLAIETADAPCLQGCCSSQAQPAPTDPLHTYLLLLLIPTPALAPQEQAMAQLCPSTHLGGHVLGEGPRLGCVVLRPCLGFSRLCSLLHLGGRGRKEREGNRKS